MPKAVKKKTKPAVKKTMLRAKKSAPKAKKRVRLQDSPAEKVPVKRKGYGKEELEYFRNLIQEKRKEILEDLESLKSSMMDVTTGEYVSENSTYSLHMEQGTDTMEREKTFMHAAREGKFLNYLDDALKRIDKGVFGFCNECGKLIEKERLEAVPHAQMCVTCKVKKGK
jgi:DnaK suppressor protein